MAENTPESDLGSIECFQNYTAPEVFIQGLAGIVDQQDVEAMIRAQKQIIFKKMAGVGALCSRKPFNIWKYSLQLTIKKLHSATNGETHFHDIIIAGGGMVGTTLACLLSQNQKLKNKNILLLEGNSEQQWSLKPCYSNRVSALNPSTKELLTKIGAWKHIADARYKAVKKMQVWEAFSDAVITFNYDDMAQNVAYIVENDVLLAAVKKCLVECGENVTVLYKTKVKSYMLPAAKTASNEPVHMEIEDGTKFSCSLLVGADGANSDIRKCMGVHYLSWSYNQMGIVATVKLSEATENVVAWQRFIPTGPVALLPLTNELSSLVWSVSMEQARNLLKLPDESFVDALNEALWKQYPQKSAVASATHFVDSLLQPAFLSSSVPQQLQPSVSSVEEGSRAAFPLGFGHSAFYATSGVVLVGDAAHRIHPLAGQGVNLGFGDICCLSETLGEAVGQGKFIGSLSHLLKYETARQKHNVPTMLVIDGLQKLYGSTLTPLILFRSIGLQLINAVYPFKKAIMNHAALLQRFEKTNEMLTNCNALSVNRLKSAGTEFKKHTQLLLEMKKDLDNIFKRMRVLKTKLASQYPEAFSVAEEQKMNFHEAMEEPKAETSKAEQTPPASHVQPDVSSVGLCTSTQLPNSFGNEINSAEEEHHPIKRGNSSSTDSPNGNSNNDSSPCTSDTG